MKKVISLTILIIDKKKKLYTKIYHLDKDTIKTNHVLVQMLEKKCVQIFHSKKEAFCIKTII